MSRNTDDTTPAWAAAAGSPPGCGAPVIHHCTPRTPGHVWGPRWPWGCQHPRSGRSHPLPLRTPHAYECLGCVCAPRPCLRPPISLLSPCSQVEAGGAAEDRGARLCARLCHGAFPVCISGLCQACTPGCLSHPWRVRGRGAVRLAAPESPVRPPVPGPPCFPPQGTAHRLHSLQRHPRLSHTSQNVPPRRGRGAEIDESGPKTKLCNGQ